jgi:hypothetical protein
MNVRIPADIGQAQRERLAYIDFRLYFLGEVSRADISSRFGVAPAGATRDLAIYREAAPKNIAFDGSTKTYRIGPAFHPLFDHPLNRTLSALSQGFGDGIGGSRGGLVPCEFPEPINCPAIDTLAAMTRAIQAHAVLSVWYTSLTGGETKREIVPFALADNGLRWHIRAFDRNSRSFRDFVLTRIRRAARVSVVERAKKIGPVSSMYVIHRPDGKPYTASGLRRTFAIACKRAGVSGVTLKDIRKLAACDAATGGATLEQIKTGWAHRDLATTEVYIKNLVSPVSRIRLRKITRSDSR